MATRKSDIEEIKQLALNDLNVFATLVNPNRVYGDVHRELFYWWEREDALDNSLVLLPRDHQKAGRLDQHIITPEGHTTHGDVVAGQEVIGLDGKPTTVREVHPVEKMDVYTVTMSDGREFTCSGKHLFLVECPSNWGKAVLKERTVLELLENYQSKRFDKRHNKEFIEARYFIYPSSPIAGENVNLGIDPYTLGVWLGDGDSATGAITTADKELLNYIPYSTHKVECKKYSYRVEGLTSRLSKLGLINNKHIPEAYFRSNKKEELLQGLIDTDGHVHVVNKNLSYTTVSERLKDDVVRLVRMLGGKATCSDQWTSYKQEGEKFHSYCINIWLPDCITPCKLERKLKRVQKGMRLKSSIVNIESAGVAEARCITVDNKDGMYLTNDYLPTHNSHAAAVKCAHLITKYPDHTILYVSATAALAEKQLYAIKNILTSPIYRRYWPEMVEQQEGKREIWNNTEIAVDHPLRKTEGVRDPTVKAAGLTTNITGFHARHVFLDDIVVPSNAYTEEGRALVRKLYSQLSSVETTGAKETVVGTRYHPADIYSDLKEMKETTYDEEGNPLTEVPVYEVFERVVETDGVFLWPKEFRADGKHFGFDHAELARKRAKYLDKTQFYAQYYNDPNDPDSHRLDSSRFQYYKNEFLTFERGVWKYKDKKLRIFAAADLAFTINTQSDYTAVVVIGVDEDGYIYVLDLVRFKTDKYDKYYDEIIALHQKWLFKKIRIETNAGGSLVAGYLRDAIRRNGDSVSVDEKYASRRQGAKEERIAAILEPRYENLTILHAKGGMTNVLENELILSRPKNDDLKDALAAAVEISHPPSKANTSGEHTNVIQFNKRFGGVIR